MAPLLDEHLRLTRADHQTHRRLWFDVPEGCAELWLDVRYSPKLLSLRDSEPLVRQAVDSQLHALAGRVGTDLAQRWAVDFEGAELMVPNLVTISLDDASGAYRGAGHRHRAEQHLRLASDAASPGLIPGPLPAGRWTLTLTMHTIVSDQCEVEIQIGAEMASSSPMSSRVSA